MSLEVSDDSIEIESLPAADESVETPSTEPAPEASEAVPTNEMAAPAEPIAPAYQPNFKYSVRGQEKEVDEMFRALIKDAESEKKIKELFEKAEGLDFVKQDRQALKAESEGFRTQVMPYLQEYDKFTTLRDKGNLGAAFEIAGISDEQIFQYAIQKIQAEQNPHLAQTMQSHQQLSVREIEMERRLQMYEQQDAVSKEQKFYQDLEASITSANDVASAVDQRSGKMGAFKEEVIHYGLAQQAMGRILTVDQATEEVANKYRPFIMPSTPAAPQAPVQSYQRPATLPNVGSANASVVKAAPKSIDDLRKLAKEEG